MTPGWNILNIREALLRSGPPGTHRSRAVLARGHLSRFFSQILIGLLLSTLASCGNGTLTPTVSPATPTSPAPTLTPTALEPSSTPQPLAALVNGEGITLSQYQAELARYQSAAGIQLTTEENKRILNDLIDQLLLAQAAAEAGFSVDEEALQARIEDLASRMGGPQALTEWMSANGYSEETFRQELARSVAAAWMRDQIIAEVPETAEQVHARQILLYNAEQANETLARLRNGKDFAELAAEVDPMAKGDLGWFPRGYLFDPKLEEAAFSLQPDEYSEIIQTAAGFHILKVIERDPERPLNPDSRLALQQGAVKNWLSERRSQSKIEILTP